jgi:hypothetical protein
MTKDIDVARYKNVRHSTFIEQKGECIIRYFGMPCDEFAERVWPIIARNDGYFAHLHI